VVALVLEKNRFVSKRFQKQLESPDGMFVVWNQLTVSNEKEVSEVEIYDTLLLTTDRYIIFLKIVLTLLSG
jgi:hypothetical protein